jgi:hypothetical protein
MTEVSQMKNTRRTFLKKVVYVAPAVVGLGVLIAPAESQAKELKSRTVPLKSTLPAR